MGHSFEIFKYLIKEKMVGQKHLRENLTFLNYWVSSWLNFRFSQIPRIALNALFISPPENITKRKDFSENQGLSPITIKMSFCPMWTNDDFLYNLSE